MRWLSLLAVLAFAACGSKPPPPAQASPPPAAATGKPCASQSECGAGEMCAGPAGCDIAWSCVPAHPCTMDAMTFCSCDGKSVIGSSTCPPQPYRHRGECP